MTQQAQKPKHKDIIPLFLTEYQAMTLYDTLELDIEFAHDVVHDKKLKDEETRDIFIEDLRVLKQVLRKLHRVKPTK